MANDIDAAAKAVGLVIVALMNAAVLRVVFLRVLLSSQDHVLKMYALSRFGTLKNISL